MPTAACGINCDVCGLNGKGICSSCGSGISPEGKAKRRAQEKLFGSPCPILACAQMNHLEYCPRDCKSFPCENFDTQEYPFSKGYLQMQRRRRTETSANSKSRLPGAGSRVVVPAEYWDELRQKDPGQVCRLALAQWEATGHIRLRVMNTDFLVDPRAGTLQAALRNGETVPVQNPLLELTVLVYLLQITDAPLRLEKVGIQDLKSAHFFQGPHELNMKPLIQAYGNHIERFRETALRLGGRTITCAADAGVVFSPLPKLLVYFLLWQADEEFPARLTVLFDRSIEDHFAADFIWALVRFMMALLLDPGSPFYSPIPGDQR